MRTGIKILVSYIGHTITTHVVQCTNVMSFYAQQYVTNCMQLLNCNTSLFLSLRSSCSNSCITETRDKLALMGDQSVLVFIASHESLPLPIQLVMSYGIPRKSKVNMYETRVQWPAITMCTPHSPTIKEKITKLKSEAQELNNERGYYYTQLVTILYTLPLQFFTLFILSLFNYTFNCSNYTSLKEQMTKQIINWRGCGSTQFRTLCGTIP
jgi:hypothetical protein